MTSSGLLLLLQLGIIGGIIAKFTGPKPKKMILPDDKNKTVNILKYTCLPHVSNKSFACVHSIFGLFRCRRLEVAGWTLRCRRRNRKRSIVRKKRKRTPNLPPLTAPALTVSCSTTKLPPLARQIFTLSLSLYNRDCVDARTVRTWRQRLLAQELQIWIVRERIRRLDQPRVCANQHASDSAQVAVGPCQHLPASDG